MQETMDPQGQKLIANLDLDADEMPRAGGDAPAYSPGKRSPSSPEGALSETSRGSSAEGS